ncbi:GNAT family N-acetyltransferase [Agromyces sp. NPDC058126]|uniref:GNAT family N-acetyltransferase n=1 Tax=Agromyces sp. NPDC058126 TaxID=3346350 RepID=UPI0036DD3415
MCAEPPRLQYELHRGNFHPRLWELEVQSGLRTLHPPVPESEALLLAQDDAGDLAAVTRVSFDSDGEQLMVLAVAVRVDLRGQGIGNEALEAGLTTLHRTKADNGMDCGIWARIHQDNEPSKRLFARFGFESLGAVEGSALESWVLS